MSLKDSIRDELNRTPVAAISGAVGVLVSVVGFVVGWLQNRAGSITTTNPTAQNVPTDFYLGNLLIVVSYFLAVTITTSLILRMAARKHDTSAFLGSIPLFALTNASVILLMYLAPPRSLSTQLFSSAHDLVFYASAAIAITICGKAVVRNLADTGPVEAEDSEKPSDRTRETAGLVGFAILVLVLWSWLVFAGQTRLVQTLLPEVTHYKGGPKGGA